MLDACVTPDELHLACCGVPNIFVIPTMVCRGVLPVIMMQGHGILMIIHSKFDLLLGLHCQQYAISSGSHMRVK